jgi:hypothetical protein
MLGGAYKRQLLGVFDVKELWIAGVLDRGIWRRFGSFIVLLASVASCEERDPHDQQRGCPDDALIHAKLQERSSFIVVKGKLENSYLSATTPLSFDSDALTPPPLH